MTDTNSLFTANPSRSFTQKVAFNVPNQSGTWDQYKLPVDFISLPKSDVQDMTESDFSDLEVYDRVVIGVDGVGGSDGDKLPKSEAVKVMREESSFVFEVVRSYYDAILGGNLKKKTSRKQRGTG